MTTNHDLAKQIEDLVRNHVDALVRQRPKLSRARCDGTAACISTHEPADPAGAYAPSVAAARAGRVGRVGRTVLGGSEPRAHACVLLLARLPIRARRPTPKVDHVFKSNAIVADHELATDRDDASSEALKGYEAYIKASNTGADDWFGSNLALSADASTLVVRGYHESSAGTGINDNNNQSDNSKPSSGAVYIFY